MDKGNIRGKIIQLIGEGGFFVAPNGTDIHLFNDAAMDSLAFVTLLIRIEEIFSVEFDITEMEGCAELNRLVELTFQKSGGNGHD